MESENFKKPIICVPGQRLCLSDKNHTGGVGTYERNGYIYATLAGVVRITKKETTSLIYVCSFNNRTIVPAPGDIVTGKVTTVTHRYAKCDITAIGDDQLIRAYKGMVRREDMRATEKDKIEVYKCLRPGDIILARVMPVKELHCYQLSTAENELGVVTAYGEAGEPMIPISWTEVQCRKTFIKEPRKVAKIIPEISDAQKI